ncbi:hypothetical protein EV646_104135 [Kribbella antiqua]|uniref:Uncharacterized protein n=1 Tax=Kribbella antiqua TaxID=2512217 RepID=A0A4R2IVQ7_9ACTN|nr:hypothetical protein [Kribbella antiqua]TCO48318.1 hypothetical protein EV646_104135 [Kribbella antiqua]
MTPPVVISDTQRARQVLRDARGNLDEPPARNDGVSLRGMTESAYATRGASGGLGQQSGLSGDLAASVNAAAVPQVAPGQQHNAAGTGERGQTTTGRENGRQGRDL